jgi:tetratricopeptide (TPR) repeat protein
MSRFDRLEFEPARQQKPAVAQPVSEAETDDANWLKKAITERQKGLHEAALRLYSRALEWDRSLVAGWVGQVQMLIALQEYPEAELWAKKALELFKNNPELLAARAQALCRLGNLNEAQIASDMSLNQQGQSAYPWLVRAEVILARKEKNETYCFDKAVQSGGDWLMLLDMAAVYEQYGRINQSLIRARQAVERAPGQAYCWYCQGKYEASLGLNRPAEISFKRCLELVPNHVEAHRAWQQVRRGGPGMRRLFRRWFGG